MKNQIQIIKSDNICKKDIKRYRRKYSPERVITDPIPEDEFAALISVVANSPGMQERLGNVEIVMIPWGMSARAWIDPDEPNKIFIPKYDMRDCDIESSYGLIALANALEYLHPRLADKKQFQEWKASLQEVTLIDALEKTLLHEKGHLEVMDMLEQDSGKKAYRNYFCLKHSGINKISFFVSEVREYVNLPDVSKTLWKLLKAPEVQPENIPLVLGELIAEDYRILKAPGKTFYFPHSKFYKTDLLNPKRQKARLDILRKILC